MGAAVVQPDIIIEDEFPKNDQSVCITVCLFNSRNKLAHWPLRTIRFGVNCNKGC